MHVRGKKIIFITDKLIMKWLHPLFTWIEFHFLKIFIICTCIYMYNLMGVHVHQQYCSCLCPYLYVYSTQMASWSLLMPRFASLIKKEKQVDPSYHAWDFFFPFIVHPRLNLVSFVPRLVVDSVNARGRLFGSYWGAGSPALLIRIGEKKRATRSTE